MIFSKSKTVYVLYAAFFILISTMAGNHEVYAEAMVPDGLVIEDVFKPGLGAPVGMVVLVQGKVVIIHASDLLHGYWAKKDIPLFKGDTIITQEDGRIRFELNDGSALTLASKTKLEINQNIYDPANKTRSSFLSMTIGKARFWVKKLTDFKRSDFKIKTTTAIVGVRGSDFIIVATEERTEVTALEKTEIEVISLIRPDAEPVILTDFEQTHIEIGKLPSDPKEVLLEDIDVMKQDFIIMPETVRPEDKGIIEEKTVMEKPAEEGILVPDDVLVLPEAIDDLERTENVPEKDESDKQEESIIEQQKAVAEEHREDVKKALPDFPVTPE